SGKSQPRPGRGVEEVAPGALIERFTFVLQAPAAPVEYCEAASLASQIAFLSKSKAPSPVGAPVDERDVALTASAPLPRVALKEATRDGSARHLVSVPK